MEWEKFAEIVSPPYKASVLSSDFVSHVIDWLVPLSNSS